MKGPMAETLQVHCCIAGGGPADMMLGYLLGRAGVKTLVLEKHADFVRDFRGDHRASLDPDDHAGVGANRLFSKAATLRIPRVVRENQRYLPKGCRLRAHFRTVPIRGPAAAKVFPQLPG